MPYKDKEVQKQKQRELMQAKRDVNPAPCEPKDVNPKTNYVIPMTRKAAIEICRANRGGAAPLIEELKRKVFSALHIVYDCRYPAVGT